MRAGAFSSGKKDKKMKKEKEKSYLGRKSREKGKRGEREVAGILREHGYHEARRGVQYSGRTGAADVIGLPGWHIEVKRVEHFDLISAASQAERDARAGERWVVFHRPSRRPWISVLPDETFEALAGGSEDWNTETEKKISKVYEALGRAQHTAGGNQRPSVHIKTFTIMYLDDFLDLIK